VDVFELWATCSQGLPSMAQRDTAQHSTAQSNISKEHIKKHKMVDIIHVYTL
jgi:hypothetical protein